MSLEKKYAVEMHKISKYFGNFCALDKVDLKVEKGTIHALLGENGAGKSTLMNVLYGLYKPEIGEILINGEKVDIKNPNIAISHGIGMVHQHFMLIDNFTVVQNVMLGMEKTKGMGVLDHETVKKEIVELSNKYNLIVDPDSKIQDISVGMQQRVEIIKALYRGAEILILDEPTAVLTPQEISELIDIMKMLIDDGKTIIIITHKLSEIKSSAERCTVIRRGKYIDTVDVGKSSIHDLASMMVGRDVSLEVKKSPCKSGEEVFKIENLIVKDARGIEKVNGFNLSVKRGEIMAIAGVDGNGQSELIEALTGLRKGESGKVLINGVDVFNKSSREIFNSKISNIPEDRQKHGLVMDFTVAENMVIENFRNKEFSSRGILKSNKIIDFTKKLIQEFDIRPGNCENSLSRSLSGGNQQKVIIAREVTNDPELLIAVQPTRGLDVGAIEFVHKSLIEQRDKGKAVLLISFEIDEVMSVADRIAVIYEGKVAGIFDLSKEKVDEATLGYLMAGGKSSEKTSN
ncbi:MAG: ABC transporter ATP-binding protein [Filifactoraceae bacterium]